MRSARQIWRQQQLPGLPQLEVLNGSRVASWCTSGSWPLPCCAINPLPHSQQFATEATSSAPRNFAKERKQYTEELHKLRVEWQNRRLEAQTQQKEAFLRRQEKRSAARTRQQAESDEVKAAKLAQQAEHRMARLEEKVCAFLAALSRLTSM